MPLFGNITLNPWTSQVSPKLSTPSIEHSINLTAKSARVFDLTSDKTLVDYESQKLLPIASLTKIMTAYIVLTHKSPNDKVRITRNALNTPGEAGSFKEGEVLTIRDLVSAMMMYSSNDAAMALAENIGGTAFVNLMNKEAAALGMYQTTFYNPTGLDSNDGIASNYSSAQDLSKLIRKIFQDTPLVWELSRDQHKTIYSQANVAHALLNLNELINRVPHIIGGKTGTTNTAGESFIMLYEDPLGSPKALVLLGAEPGKRFEETQRILKYISTLR